MKEARIILPTAAYSPKVSAALRSAGSHLVSELVTAFGGVTTYQAEGYWREPGPSGAWVREPVRIFDVACPDDRQTCDLLMSIAQEAGRLGLQQSVYFRDPDGQVRFLMITNPDPAEIAEAEGERFDDDGGGQAIGARALEERGD